MSTCTLSCKRKIAGAFGLVAIVRGRDLVIANAGSCRAVLGRETTADEATMKAATAAVGNDLSAAAAPGPEDILSLTTARRLARLQQQAAVLDVCAAATSGPASSQARDATDGDGINSDVAGSNAALLIPACLPSFPDAAPCIEAALRYRSETYVKPSAVLQAALAQPMRQARQQTERRLSELALASEVARQPGVDLESDNESKSSDVTSASKSADAAAQVSSANSVSNGPLSDTYSYPSIHSGASESRLPVDFRVPPPLWADSDAGRDVRTRFPTNDAGDGATNEDDALTPQEGLHQDEVT